MCWNCKEKNLYETTDYLKSSPFEFHSLGTKKINKIICNRVVAHAITGNINVNFIEMGCLYSWGDDKEKIGVLGLDEIYKTSKPIQNEYLKGKFISNISMSKKHCCALDSINILYNFR